MFSVVINGIVIIAGELNHFYNMLPEKKKKPPLQINKAGADVIQKKTHQYNNWRDRNRTEPLGHTLCGCTGILDTHGIIVLGSISAQADLMNNPTTCDIYISAKHMR